MARLDRKLEVSWAQLKELAGKKYVGFHSFETQNASEVYIIEDGKPSFWSAIFKDNDPRYAEEDRDDWEMNYLPDANGPTKPRDRDGRDKTQPVTVAKGQWHTWHSYGDSDSEIGAGTFFGKSHAAAGWCTPVEWHYRDPIWIVGGGVEYAGAVLGDLVDFTIFAPATPVTPNGGNTGNCNVVGGVVVPAAGNGAYDVNLTGAPVVPIPAGTGGYWDYAMPATMTGHGTVTPSAPGEGGYHLIAARTNLVHFVIKEAILGEGAKSYSPTNPNPSTCLPCWKFECKLYNTDGEHTVEAIWHLLTTRYSTTL